MNIETTLCIHDLQKDHVLSPVVWNTGIWEKEILQLFIQAINQNPDSIVFDFGANTGQYTLFAAKMGKNVISVEPLYDNLLRIHKAAKLENIQSKIKLFKMALSNKKNEFKLLQDNNEPHNLGAQGLKTNNDDEVIDLNKLDEKAKRYLVKTGIPKVHLTAAFYQPIKFYESGPGLEVKSHSTDDVRRSSFPISMNKQNKNGCEVFKAR